MEKRIAVATIYKITYPNGKIYIGQDRTDDVNYFGSADSFTIAQDFNAKQRDDFIVHKQILKRLHNVTVQQINTAERKFIAQYESNNPDIGYNRTGIARRKRTTQFC